MNLSSLEYSFDYLTRLVQILKRKLSLCVKVEEELAALEDDEKANAYVIDGLNKQSIRDLKKFAKNGTCELGNLIEVMACPGGCLGGSSTINAYKPALKQLTSYVQESPEIKDVVKD